MYIIETRLLALRRIPLWLCTSRWREKPQMRHLSLTSIPFIIETKPKSRYELGCLTCEEALKNKRQSKEIYFQIFSFFKELMEDWKVNFR